MPTLKPLAEMIRPNTDYSKLSISDQQTLKLLHRRRSSATSAKDVVDERKVFRCTYCPYTNHRRDALDNHTRRHASASGITSNFMCPYCDYAAPQSQFLRDHIKVHFQVPKHINPDYFTNFDGLNVFIKRLLDNSDEAINESLFTLKENMDISNIKDDNAKIYVVPNSGERIL
jgi:KRAB domain-containing zinc finger protein